MSGRLVGEVAEWLRTPASAGLTLAERMVLLVIAERANERDREMWRHRGDEVTLFERLCQVTRMDRSGLTKVLKKLAARGLEVRVQIGESRSGSPVFAYRGVAMRFCLPELPASVSLPERADERAPFPVDNPVDDTSEGREKGCPDGDPFDGKGGRAGTQWTRKGGRAGTPNTSKDNPSTTDPSTCGSPPYVAEEESEPPPAATPSGDSKIHMGYDPAYRDARAVLERLPDLGGTFMAAAREALGEQTPLIQLVVYAGRLAKEAS